MENATEALRMAGGVLIFVLALTISINAFTQSRQGIDNLVLYSDREFLSTYVEQNKGTKRIVGADSIVPTIYRAYKENIKIDFAFLGDSDDPIYTKGDEKINYIDLENETHGNETLKEYYLKKILFGNDDADKMYKQAEIDQFDKIRDKNIKFNPGGLYKRLTTDPSIGGLLGTYEESLGVYYPTESEGTTDKSTINKTEKKVITYRKVNPI